MKEGSVIVGMNCYCKWDRHGKSGKVSASSVITSEIFRQYIVWLEALFAALRKGGSISVCDLDSLH